jgi:septum formation protein
MQNIVKNTLILGSSSPRRKEILSYFNLPFVQISPDFDETSIAFKQNPENYATLLAQKKAESLQKIYPDHFILTADTVVFCKDKLFNKPSSEKEALQMLLTLSGSWHQVFTGICVVKNKEFYARAEETKILFHPLTEKQIKIYHQHFYYGDKAGGYAIQGGGSIIVKKIDGCPYNVMGLPITTTRELLEKIGIDLWDCLKKLPS